MTETARDPTDDVLSVLTEGEREWVQEEERWVRSTPASRIIRRLARELAEVRKDAKDTMDDVQQLGREYADAEARGYARGWHEALDAVEDECGGMVDDYSAQTGEHQKTMDELRSRHARQDALKPTHETLGGMPIVEDASIPDGEIRIRQINTLRRVVDTVRVVNIGPPKPEPAAERCVWVLVGDRWNTGCGSSFWGPPQSYQRCGNCGKPIEVAGGEG